MISQLRYFLSILTCCISTAAFAQADSTFHLYLLAGQSNMAGRGEISGKYATEGSPQVYMLTKNKEWIPAKNPLHFDKPAVAGVGPGLAFGLEMAAANPGIKIGLIPCAVGGTSINTWKAGGYDQATQTHPYDDAVVRIREAMKSGVFKGIIWHQGESDSSPQASANYFAKLADLIESLRNIIKDQKLPFVAGELGTFKAPYNNINSVLKQVPKQIKHTAVASSKGLEHKGDVTHFNSPSAEKLGKRFAKQMRKLQRR